MKKLFKGILISSIVFLLLLIILIGISPDRCKTVLMHYHGVNKYTCED